MKSCRINSKIKFMNLNGKNLYITSNEKMPLDSEYHTH